MEARNGHYNRQPPRRALLSRDCQSFGYRRTPSCRRNPLLPSHRRCTPGQLALPFTGPAKVRLRLPRAPQDLAQWPKPD